MLRHTVIATIAMTAAAVTACLAAPLVDDPGPRPDYRKLVRTKLPTLLPAKVKRGVVELSPLRPAQASAPAPWIACLLVDARGTPLHMALFLNDHEIVDSRLSVAIDQCENERYMPLTKAAKARRKRR